MGLSMHLDSFVPQDSSNLDGEGVAHKAGTHSHYALLAKVFLEKSVVPGGSAAMCLPGVFERGTAE